MNPNYKIKDRKSKLQKVRPDDKKSKEYFKYANELLIKLRVHFGELNEYYSADNSEAVLRDLCGSHGE